MRRYCPICGEVFPGDSRLCPNCDKERIEAQRLNRQARNRQEQVYASRGADSKPAAASVPTAGEDPDNNKIIKIAIIAAVIMAVIVCVVLIALGTSSGNEQQGSGSDTSVVETASATESEDYYQKANTYFNKNILSQYADQNVTGISYFAENGKICFYDNSDGDYEYLLDYAFVDIGGDEQCDIVVAKLVPDKEGQTNSLGAQALISYETYICGEDGKFTHSTESRTSIKNYDDDYNVTTGRLYGKNGGKNFAELLSLSRDNSQNDAIRLSDGTTLVCQDKDGEKTYKVNKKKVSLKKFNKLLSQNGLDAYTYTADSAADFTADTDNTSLIVRFSYDGDTVSFQTFLGSTEQPEETSSDSAETSAATYKAVPPSTETETQRTNVGEIVKNDNDVPEMGNIIE